MSVQFDDQMPDHPKIIAAGGGDAGWLLFTAVCHARRYGTDGRISDALIPRLSDRRQPRKLWDRMWAEDLVHAEGETCESPDCPASAEPTPSGHWTLHDYWRWNDSKAEIDRKRAESARRVREYRERKRNASSNGDGNNDSNGARNALRNDPGNGEEMPPSSSSSSSAIEDLHTQDEFTSGAGNVWKIA